MAGSSQYRFGVLAKIVKHMKNRHQDGEEQALTLEDILDETNQLDIGSSVKNVSRHCLDSAFWSQITLTLLVSFCSQVASNRGIAEQSQN